MNGKKGITDLIRGDATCPYMKNIPGLKKDFEVFKKDGSVSIKDFEVLKNIKVFLENIKVFLQHSVRAAYFLMYVRIGIHIR